ncbi:hypothetical protein K439DRAFT_1623078 [Ramaria rubella]|nr:hypothetical protein K439DRAFT_1623078 [Ramaria rubella]
MGLSRAVLNQLGQHRIMSPLLGFLGIADIPMWRLGTLTVEEYIDKDILNAMLEMNYLLLARQTSGQSKELIFPTSFYTAASFLYHHSLQVYNKNLHDVQEQLVGSKPLGFGVVVCQHEHYTAFYYNATSQLHHYDSLGGPPVSDVQHLTNWILQGLDLPQITSIISEDGPLQSSASGSCGIATANFLQMKMGVQERQWSKCQSVECHREWPQKLVMYHMCINTDEPVNWFSPEQHGIAMLHNPIGVSEPDFGLVYSDFSIHTVHYSHPIHSYCQQVMTTRAPGQVASVKLLVRVSPFDSMEAARSCLIG